MARSRPLLLALILLGCHQRELTPSPPPEEPHRQPGLAALAAASRPAPRPVQFASRVESPGGAYFVVDGTGLVQLRDGIFSALPDVSGMVKALALSKEGLLVSNYTGLFLLKPNGVTEKLGDAERPGSVEEIAVGPDGTLWTMGYGGVGRYDGKGWTLHAKTVFGDARVLRGLAVDGNGSAWVSTAAALYRNVDGAWIAVDTSEAAGADPFFQNLSTGADGGIYASLRTGLLRCDDKGCHKLGQLGERPNLFAVAPDGRVLICSGLNQLSLIGKNGKLTALKPEEHGFRAKAVRFIAADAADRFWLASDQGLVVLDSDGNGVQWEPGHFEEVSGPVNFIMLEGEGPNLPALGAKAQATVKGRLLHNGVPVSHATVEICESPSLFTAGTPCREASFMRSTTTDAHGAFHLSEVPAGIYRFAINSRGKWRIAIADSCCARIKAGQSYDVGFIEL